MKNLIETVLAWLNHFFQSYDHRKEFDPHTEPDDDNIEDGADVPDDCKVCLYSDDGIDIETVEPSADEVKKYAPRYMWCVNNGHGKNQRGKRSPFWTDKEGVRRQFHEYLFNRAVVAFLLPMLDERGIKYFNVVPEIEVGSFLDERIARANNHKSHLEKIYLSVHSNAAAVPNPVRDWCDSRIKGVETWFYHTSKKGRKAASIFQNILTVGTGWRNRYIKSRPEKQFRELKKTKMVAILVELGFYNNFDEVKELSLETVQKDFARLLCKAIVYVEIHGLNTKYLPSMFTDKGGTNKTLLATKYNYKDVDSYEEWKAVAGFPDVAPKKNKALREIIESEQKYYYLREGDIIQESDEVMLEDGQKPIWVKTKLVGSQLSKSGKLLKKYRRLIQ